MSVKFLLKRLEFHYKEVERIDKQLAQICEREMKPYLDNKEYDYLKYFVNWFYNDYSKYSTKKDILIAKIDRLRKQNNPE